MSVEHKIILPRQSFRIMLTQLLAVQGWAVSVKDHRGSSTILNKEIVESILEDEPPKGDANVDIKEWMSKEFEIVFSENEREALKTCVNKSIKDGTFPVNKYGINVIDALGLE